MSLTIEAPTDAQLDALDPLLYRLFYRIRPNLYTGCWEWMGPKDRGGYGSVSRGATTVRGHHRPERVHRVIYERLVGEIPKGLQIDHLCRNRACVNPKHLEPVTPKENSRRAVAQITHCPQGHPYDEANTVVRRNGHRECRVCRNKAARERMRRRTPGEGAMQRLFGV